MDRQRATTWLMLLLAGLTGTANERKDPPWPRLTEDGYAVPQPGHSFQFPRDHGSHPGFAIEWWYLTGHLFADGNHRFGFQATFFRQAGPRNPGNPPFREFPAPFADDQLYLAHMALVDLESATFLHQERLNRAGWNAHAATGSLDLRNGPWSLRQIDGSHPETMALIGSIRSDAALNLELTPEKEKVIFGEDGVSRKGDTPTASSHYITFTRLRATGTVELDGRQWTVTGQAWMDHEISSNQLTEVQVGWNWAQIQFGDGRELMAYVLRRRDGSHDPASSLTWIERDGRLVRSSPPAFAWIEGKTWTSPETGGVYPIHSQLETIDPATGEAVRYSLDPFHPDQELTGELGGIAYWEGAIRVLDSQGRQVGLGYVELTGFAQDLGERL